MWTSFLTLLAAGFIHGSIVPRATFNCGSDTVLTTDNGTIVSHFGIANGHHYGKNVHCTWTIQAPPNMYVHLEASHFDLELDGRCAYDSLTLYDGNTTSFPEIGKFCGHNFMPVTTSGRNMTLVFESDDNNQFSGFKLQYYFVNKTTVCPGGDFACANGNCIYQRYVCDTDDDCGDDSDELHCTGGGSGFHPVNVTDISSCTPDEFRCKDSRLCILRVWVCDGDDDCQDSSDEFNCPV